MIYFDTSAMIRAFLLTKAPHGVTRKHSVAEFYSVTTGRGLTAAGGRQVRFSPAKAVQGIRETFRNISFHEPDAADVFKLLDEAVSGNVQGANIHDFFHAAAAVSANVKRLATTNLKHFAALPQKLEIVPVEKALKQSEKPPAK